MAHRFVEWDGWEEGLVDSILGPEEHDEDWLKDLDRPPSVQGTGAQSPPHGLSDGRSLQTTVPVLAAPRKRKSTRLPLPLAKEQEKEQMLVTTGDFCGGRGGELGRRLEAWLTINGIEEGHSIAMRWERDHEPLNHARGHQAVEC